LAPGSCRALPPEHVTPVAAPQCISGRTSYLHVRLEFLLYPQLIPQFCNTGGCEPRRTFTSASLWPWMAHVVSGRIPATVRALHTRFPYGSPPLTEVNQATVMHSPDHSTKGTPLALSGATPQWPLTAGAYVVSGSLSSPSRGAFHLSLTVLVHYRSLNVFSLGEWSPQLPTRFHVPRGTQDTSPPSSTVLYGILTLSDRSFQNVRVVVSGLVLVLQPHPVLRQHGLGSSRFARHYYGNLLLISFRRATEMFQFTHCPPPHLCVQ
jgi:hypothetical protein